MFYGEKIVTTAKLGYITNLTNNQYNVACTPYSPDLGLNEICLKIATL